MIENTKFSGDQGNRQSAELPIFRGVDNRPGLFYFKPSETGLDSNVVVVKRTGYPSQILVGSQASINCMDRAMEILDNVEPDGSHRQINVVVSCHLDPIQHVFELPQKKLFALDLLKRFGIDFLMDKSMYIPPSDAVDDLAVGVYADLKRPLFLSPDYTCYLKLGASLEAISVFWASQLIHEEEHVNQFRNGLPTYSLWSERRAASSEISFIRKMLRTDSFSRTDSAFFNDRIERMLQTTYDYRQGYGFDDHLIAEYFNQSPVGSESTLCTDLVE